MSIKYRNFPHDFNKKNNFFSTLLSDSFFCDYFEKKIVIYGSYPSSNSIFKTANYIRSKIRLKDFYRWQKLQYGFPINPSSDAFTMWVTYENRRPQVNLFDATISFDVDDYDGSNFYLPLLYLYLDLFETESYLPRHRVRQEDLILPRKVNNQILNRKKDFIVSFVNNPHPVRLNAIVEFQKMESVRLFGRFYNNYVDNKIELAKDYWFSLCFENDLYPGYVTEKVLEAYLGFTVPLYWGDDVLGILNPKAIINLKDFSSLRSFVQEVSEIYRDKNRLISIISEPLLNKTLNLTELKNFLLARLIHKFGEI